MAFDPITAVLGIAETVINKIFPDPAQRDAAKLELFKAQQEGQFKQMDQEFQLALEQAKTNAVEAASGSVFVSGWRPGCGWICVMGLFYTFIGQPLLTWMSLIYKFPVPPMLDSGLLVQLLIGMLGLAGWRSMDKANGVANK